MIKLIVTILLTIYNSGVHSADLCKLTGVQGQSPPDILSLVKDQKGYSGIIEIVESSPTSIKQLTNQFKDSYDTVNKVGSIEWLNSGEGLTTIKSAHYYFASSESFIINKDKTPCTTSKLTIDDQRSIIFEWMTPEMRQIYNSANSGHWKNLLGIDDEKIEYLGPTVLMIMASKLSSTFGYYKGRVILDGFNVDQWSMCLSPSDSDLVIDTYFLANSNLPYRLVISGQSTTTKTKTLVNFLTYDPILPMAEYVLTFPMGHGCRRDYKYNNPTWTTTPSYLIGMEAAISYNQPDRLTLSTIKLIKHQNVYSYTISQGNSNTVRIIKTPSLLQYFKVNPRTGTCTIEHENSFFSLTSKTITTQWPLLENDLIKYNLLSPSLFTLDGTNFLGAVRTDFGKLHVFEKIVDSFYVNSANERVNCLVQFYFPEAVTHDKLEIPHHVVIKPFSSSVEDEILMASVPSRIEITYVDYKTGDDNGYSLIDPVDYADAFDVSGCYDKSGQYTWFQLVFPDTTFDIAQYQDSDSIIFHSFSVLIEPLIPLLRLPEIRVTIFGPNIYVTCKLLQAETFNFLSLPNTVIANPTRLVVREYMEDCSELCLDVESCSAFAHCGNMQCYLFTSTSEIYSTEHRDDCTVYASMSSSDLSAKSQVEINLLKSSKNILHQLRNKLENGELVLTSLRLSAGDLFIINGPDEIGGVDEEIPMNQLMDRSSMGDDFQVLIANQRFTGGSRVVGLNYQSCLSLCNNDDDCYTLSYCPAPNSECVIMNKTIDQVKAESTEISSYVDGCDILSKSFLSFYHKLPGRSLVRDAMATIANVQPEECSRRCSQSIGFDCQSFDFCPSIENSQDKKSESACFLHNLHVANDQSHELDGNVWDITKAECDHYSRKLSKDYQHIIGRKLSSNTHILGSDKDISLERCAFQCNDLSDQCFTFEYCESGDSLFTSTCKLTDYIPKSSNDKQLESTSVSSSPLCSIYINRKSQWRVNSGHFDDEIEGGLGMAMALGAFFFISAFAIGTIASHLYIKKYNS
ncbi:uncharacterized protein LOC128394197 [Panonychus citri]|uniref:uncharacterized protein LOC128394197 n=1 Tax=Panonychus citri TaxID=50023 RepID=UPI00230727F7|nr:uncharacterized protein LOC128394197 [Panonychus citri]